MAAMHAGHEALQAVVGRALVDPTYRRGLLNGHRAECLAEYGLSPEEHRVASGIRAGDLSSFARQLDHWVTERVRREGQVASLAAVRVRRVAVA